MLNLAFFTLILFFAALWKYQPFRLAPYMVLWVYMAFQYGFGDYFSYLNMYETYHNGYYVKTPYLYGLLMKISPSFTILVVISSTIFVVALYLLFEKMGCRKDRAWYFLILLLNPYILLMDMSAIRQTLALSCFIIGLYLCKKYKNALLLAGAILIATLFHTTAIVLMPFIILLYSKEYSKKKALFIILACAIAYFGQSVFDSVIRWVLEFFNNKNYYAYVNTGLQNSTLAVLSSTVIFLFLINQSKKTDADEFLFMQLAILGLFFEVLQGKIQILGRMCMYLNIFYPLGIMTALKKPIVIQFFSKRLHFTFGANVIAGVCIFALYAWKMRMFLFDTGRWAYHNLLFYNMV